MPTLTVTVLHTKGIKGGDITSEADPYVKLKYGKQTFKTRVQQDAGSDAEFNETFVFEVNDLPYEILIEVYDKDFIFDQFLGRTTVAFELVEHEQRILEEFQLRDKREKENGTITLALKFTP